MPFLRRLVRRQPALVVMIAALALLARILVPGGFMPMMQDGRIVVGVCNGQGAAQMVVEIPGLKHEGKALAKGSCAFSDLSLPALVGADPVLLAGLIAFVLALGLAFAAAPPPAAPARLRPPLRAPPRTV